ncbi:MAG: alpha/beta hydrolase [Candidatus Thiodiazotropha sp. (ex. Lucinoma kazani)]
MAEWKLPEAYVFEGKTIRYGVNGNGPPVVMVHGTPWSSFNLRYLIEAISQDFTVYYYDLIGYGQSDKSPGNVSLGIQNQVLDQLLDCWGLDNPAIIGHDFGGTTALRTHLISGRNFDRIILIDPVAVSPWGSPFFQHVNTHEAAFAGVPDYIHEAIVRAYVNTAACKPIDDTTLNMIVRPWAETGGKAAFYRQIAQANSGFTDEVQPMYSKIAKPVLILWGREDTWIPFEQGKVLHNMIPNSLFYVIPDAGHLVIEEQPDLLIEKIRPFLQNEVIT